MHVRTNTRGIVRPSRKPALTFRWHALNIYSRKRSVVTWRRLLWCRYISAYRSWKSISNTKHQMENKKEKKRKNLSIKYTVKITFSFYPKILIWKSKREILLYVYIYMHYLYWKIILFYIMMRKAIFIKSIWWLSMNIF